MVGVSAAFPLFPISPKRYPPHHLLWSWHCWLEKHNSDDDDNDGDDDDDDDEDNGDADNDDGDEEDPATNDSHHLQIPPYPAN